MRGTDCVERPVARDEAARELIQRLRAGDEDAWRDFIARYRRLVFGAIHQVNHRYDAGWGEMEMEELFSDALYRLLRDRGRALATWRGRCRLETWIYRIVRNICIDRLRKATRRGESQEIDEERPSRERQSTGAKDPVELSDLRMTLEQAIDAVLEDREALAVRLIYFEGNTYRDVAAALDMTVGAVSGMVYRALAKLRTVDGIAPFITGERS